MAREFTRSDRVGDAIQRYLATIIPQELRDPRIGMVNVNDVTVTRDMSYAKAYVTFVDSDEAQSIEAVAVLNKAAGFLRTRLAKELTMRGVPKLQFFYDKTAIKGQALSSLIDRAVASNSNANDDNSDENA